MEALLLKEDVAPKRMKHPVLIILCAAAIGSGCSALHEQAGGSPQTDQNVLTGGPYSGTRIEELPEPVRAALQKYAPDAEIADIDKTIRNGKEFYEVSFSEPGRNPKVLLSGSGQILSDSRLPR